MGYLTQTLGLRPNNEGGSHYGPYGNIGLDFSTGGKPAPIKSPIDGAKVLYAGDGSKIRQGIGNEGFGNIEQWGGMLGNTVVLQLPSGHYMVISHQSQIKVKPGDVLKNGQLIGMTGDTGNTQGIHADIMFYRPNMTLIRAEEGGYEADKAINEINSVIALNFRAKPQTSQTLARK